MSSKVHSNLQRLVLSTYANFLRASRSLDPSIKLQIQKEFRAGAKKYQPTDFLQIEYILRRAERQLRQIEKGSVVSASSLKIKRKD